MSLKISVCLLQGIETIRRDQCPLTSALLEKSVRLLFQTRDLSKVKALVYSACMHPCVYVSVCMLTATYGDTVVDRTCLLWLESLYALLGYV